MGDQVELLGFVQQCTHILWEESWETQSYSFHVASELCVSDIAQSLGKAIRWEARTACLRKSVNGSSMILEVCFLLNRCLLCWFAKPESNRDIVLSYYRRLEKVEPSIVLFIPEGQVTSPAAGYLNELCSTSSRANHMEAFPAKQAPQKDNLCVSSLSGHWALLSPCRDKSGYC